MLGTLISGGLFGFAGSIFKGVLGFFEKKNERAHEVAIIKANQAFMLAEAKAQIEVTQAQVAGAVELAETEAFKESLKMGQDDMIKESWINKLFEYPRDKWWSWLPAIISYVLVFTMAIIDCIRRLMRPVLTLYVMGGATWITTLVWQILQFHAGNTGEPGVTLNPVITPEQAYLLFLQIIDFMFFMASTGFGWWFGDRAITKGLFKKYG